MLSGIPIFNAPCHPGSQIVPSAKAKDRIENNKVKHTWHDLGSVKH